MLGEAGVPSGLVVEVSDSELNKEHGNAKEKTEKKACDPHCHFKFRASITFRLPHIVTSESVCLIGECCEVLS